MLLRALLLVLLLVVAGCDAAPELRSEDSGAPTSTADGGDENDAGVADPAPCGGTCLGGEEVCDEASGACVECVSADDCAAEAPVCSEHHCVSCAPDDESCTDPDPTDPDPTEPDPADPDPAEPASFGIRFASYNVRTSNLLNSAWGDHHRGFDDDDAARMRRVADTIAAQSLTVVATQEIRRPERDAILARLANRHGQAWGFTSQRQGRDDTIVLFLRSEWRKIRETHFIIPMQSGLEDRYQIGVLLEHRATARRVWFYSVHYAAGGSAGAHAREVAARRTVTSIRNHAVDGDLPFVLGGDFNATSRSGVGDILRAAGFMKYTRSAAARRVNDGCTTFNSLAGSEGRQRCPGGAAAHIDQVWVSRSGMRVRKYQVTATERTSRASDHNPLTTLLTRL